MSGTDASGMRISVVGVVQKCNGHRVCRAPVLRERGYIVNAFTSASRHSSRRESAMRFNLFISLVAFAIVACGGDKKSAASQAESATPAPAGVAESALAAVHAVAVAEVN